MGQQLTPKQLNKTLTNNHTLKRTLLKTGFLLFVLQFTSLFCTESNAQFQVETKTTSQQRYISGGIGIGLGVFYPGQINDYIRDETGHLLITTGLAEMYSNFFGRVSISVHPHRIIELCGFAELGWAPKYIMVYDSMDESLYFSFTRISPGFSTKIHAPIGSGRHSIFFAPGVTFNMMKFRDHQAQGANYKANALGGRMQIGFHLDLKKIVLKPYIGYDHAKGNSGGLLEMNYSGGQLGVEMHF